VGLAGERTLRETVDALLPTIRSDIVFESDQIRDADFENHYRMREAESPEVNAEALQKFLAIGHDKAIEIAATEHLYAD
jgi:hypothetical protein